MCIPTFSRISIFFDRIFSNRKIKGRDNNVIGDHNQININVFKNNETTDNCQITIYNERYKNVFNCCLTDNEDPILIKFSLEISNILKKFIDNTIKTDIEILELDSNSILTLSDIYIDLARGDNNIEIGSK